MKRGVRLTPGSPACAAAVAYGHHVADVHNFELLRFCSLGTRRPARLAGAASPSLSRKPVRVLLQVATIRGWKMIEGATGKLALAMLAAGLTCGCADGSNFGLSTQSLGPDTTAAKTDPVCVSLASQINTLKGDGTIERLEKAGDGKTVKVSVKRSALQKQAELNKAYADFQTRCGPKVPAQTAQAQPAAPAAQTASTQPAAPAAGAPAAN